MNENERNNSLEETSQNIEQKSKEVVENKNEEIRSSNNDSRKGKREVVVQYRKPSFFTSLLLILMGICIATAVLGGIYLFKLKDKPEPVAEEPQTHEEVPVKEKEPETKVPDVDLNINGEFIQGLYKKIPVDYFIKETYSRGEAIVTAASIKDMQKIQFILGKMRRDKEYEEIETSQELLAKYTSFYASQMTADFISEKYDTKKLEEIYRSIFGSNTDIPRQNVETHLGFIFEYVEDEDTYYGHAYPGGGGYGYLYGTRLLDAKKSDDGKEIYLYDNYIKASDDGFSIESKYGIYVYSDHSNEEGREATVDTNYNYEIRDDIFEKYKDKLVTFKHTFKLDTNGNYYWYSTEAVNE